MRAYFGFFLFFWREEGGFLLFLGGGEVGRGVFLFFIFRDLPFVERDSLLAVNPAKFDTLNR